jgi:signal transduction histidine kinase
MRPMEILMIGPETPLLYTIGKALEAAGLYVRLAPSWAEAREELTLADYALALVKLPLAEGQDADALRLIKELHPDVKLLVLSENERLPLAAFELEVDDYLIMPCRPAELRRRILACLRRGKVVSEEATQQAKLNAINQRVLSKLGLMFHDIRSSLVSIDAGMRLLKRRADGKVGEDYDQLLAATQSKTEKLLSVTEEFLNSAFRPAADTHLDVRRDLLDPVLEELREDLRHKQLTVDINLGALPGNVFCKGEKVGLKSVLRNLLQNAVKHGETGSVLDIELERRGAEVRIRVTNSGSPIPAAYHGQIFKIGSLANRRAGAGRGLGLGLHLSRELVQSQGGDITYKPHPEGSNFIVVLPDK